MPDKKPVKSLKRLCMVVHSYYPLAESRVEREACALTDNCYEVDIICLRMEGERAFETRDGINIYRLPVDRHKGRGLVVQLLEYLSFFVLAFGKLLFLYPSRRYRVIQVHNLPDFLIFCALVPKLFGARLILDLHDLMPEFFAGSFNRDMKSGLVRLVIWQEQISCRFADHVITVTELWRDALLNRGVPPEKVSVVMNVADNRVFYPSSPTGNQETNNGGFHLIYHGSLVKRYGIDVLIRAIGIVRSQIPEIHLTIQGLGEFHKELVKLVQELDLGNHVTINAYLLHVSELPRLIRQAHVGVVPNRNDLFTGQLLPTKLLEYVALNIPVIAARTPGIETYFDETMIQFFTPGNAEALAKCIVELYSDRNRLAALVASAQRFNREYSWDKVAATYVALVDRLNSS